MEIEKAVHVYKQRRRSRQRAETAFLLAVAVFFALLGVACSHVWKLQVDSEFKKTDVPVTGEVMK